MDDNFERIKHLVFDQDGKQNITSLDGGTLVYAQDQRYYFQRMDEQVDEESVTVDRITLVAGTPVVEGLRCLREYLTVKNVTVNAFAAELLGMPELLYNETAHS